MNKTYTNILILLIIAISVVLYFSFNKTGFSQAADPTGASLAPDSQPIGDLPQGDSCMGTAEPYTPDLGTLTTYCQSDAVSNSERNCTYFSACTWNVETRTCSPVLGPITVACEKLNQQQCPQYPGCSWGSSESTSLTTGNMCAEIEKEYVDLKQRYDTLSEEERKRFVLLGEKIATCVSSNPAQARSINATAENIVHQIRCSVTGAC